MKRTAVGALLLSWMACGASGQSAPAFEEASVKPVPPPGANGTPTHVSEDPGMINYSGLSLLDLLTVAFHVKPRQVDGPEWLGSARYHIKAKLPAGATEDQIPRMLQTLLTNRFKLAAHQETKVIPVYALVVGKNGPKVKQAEGEDGLVRLSSSHNGGKLTGHLTIELLADRLSSLLDRPAVDMTGLKGAFEIKLAWSNDIDANAPPLCTAVQEMLGLKLDPRKAHVEFLVIDHVERVPSDN